MTSTPDTAIPGKMGGMLGGRVRAGLTFVLLGVTATVARAGGPTPAPEPINEYCPVMTEELVDPEFTATYRGQAIGFCCEKCVTKFKANPGRYVAKIPELQHAIAASADLEAQPQAHEHKQTAQTQPAGGFLSKLIDWLGKFHPASVNFPVAMILAAALAELLLMFSGRVFYLNAGRFCVWVGAVGAVAAGVLGWFFGGFQLADDSWVLTTHRWLGTSASLWSVLLLVLSERAVRRVGARRTAYRLVLFSGAALVGVTGFFGGSVIYGIDHYAWTAAKAGSVR